MVKFLGSPLEIPAATTGTQAARKQYVDSGDAALAARIAVLEAGGGSGGGGTGPTVGGQTLAVRSASTATNAQPGDFVLADATFGAFTVTLPPAPAVNTSVAVKKVDTGLNLITVVGSGAALIDGDADCTLTQSKSGAVFVYDGTNWQVESTVIFDPGAKNFTYRGNWSAGVTYGVNDVVFYNRNAYVAILGSTGTTPALDASTTTWGLLVLHGADGLKGDKGDKGEPGNDGAAGSKGDKGNDGTPGTPGAAATITVSGTDTLASTLPADVENTGTSSAAVLRFKIPAGPAGPRGADGTNGTNGSDGLKGDKGDTGTGFTYKGPWVSGNSYNANDVVYYQGSTYALKTAYSGAVAPTTLGSPTYGPTAVGINFRGAYATSTDYTSMDAVVYNGSTWICTYTAGTINHNAPLAGSVYWSVLGLGLVYQGDYNAGFGYNPNDVITYQGSSYINRQPSTNVAPVVGSTSPTWGLMALKGTNGTNGNDGSPGAAGTSFTFAGNWTSGSPYNVNDVVYYQGSTYVFRTAYSGTVAPNALGSATYGRAALGVNHRGAYNAGTPYYFMDAVLYNGSTWLCTYTVGSVSANAPAANSAYWTVLARGLLYQNTYNAATPYYPNDVVYYQGSAYINLVQATGVTPAVGTYWGLMALKGTDGTNGTNAVAPNFAASATQVASNAPMTATVTGTAPNFNIALAIPAGVAGTNGVTPTFTATATQLTADKAPTAAVAGTTTNPILQLGIPTAALAPTATQSGNYNANKGELVLVSGGGFTVTLPASPAKGDTVGVKKTDTSTSTVTVAAAATIDGGTVALSYPYAAATFAYDGAMWRVSSSTDNVAAAVPAGGLVGQVLVKKTPTDYDTIWTTPAVASGGGLTPTASQTGPYTATKGDLVLVNALNATSGITITLPASPTKGDTVGVKKTDTSANVVTVIGSATFTPTIDGDPSAQIASQDSAATFVYDGSNWQVVSTAVLNAGSASASVSALPPPIYISGNWYDRRATTPDQGGTLSVGTNQNLATSTIFYSPVYLPQSVSISAFGIIRPGTSTAGYTMRLGVYTCLAATGAPDSLISDFGTLVTDGSPAGLMSISGLTLTLPAGWVYFALATPSAIAAWAQSLAVMGMPAPVTGLSTASLTYTNTVTNLVGPGPTSYSQSPFTSTNSLPTKATPTANFANPTTTYMPNFWYRVA